MGTPDRHPREVEKFRADLLNNEMENFHMRSLVFSLSMIVLMGSQANAADPVKPFNGKDLTGWKAKAPGGKVGVDPADPKLLSVKPDGDELVNATVGHGKSYDLYSDAKFGDATIELEVMVPQGSNSGIYVMGEYEVQILDSFGKEKNPGPGDMGAIYGAAPPKSPVYKKPGEWSTYKIEFQAPKFEGGKKIQNAKFIKVTLNGAAIHEGVEMKGPTPGGVDGKEKATGPLMFQGNHGAVSIRNLKVTPKE